MSINNIYDLYWTRVISETETTITKFAYCVCPDCHSVAGYYPADPENTMEMFRGESMYCKHCKRDENGKKDNQYKHICSKCGWHVVEKDAGCESHPWRCNRCYTEFADENGKPSEKNIRKPDTCPTCGEKSLQKYSGNFCEYFQCQNPQCDMRFYTRSSGSMEHPLPCPSCKRNTLQDKDFELREEYRGKYEYNGEYIKVKRCTMCKKLFDYEGLHEIERFKEGYCVIEQEEKDIFADTHSLKVAPITDNTLKFME